MRFVGETDQLAGVYDEIMENFPDAELPSEDCGEWYSVDDVMMDEYECRFEELPESALLAMDGSIFIEDELPEDFFAALMPYLADSATIFFAGIGCSSSVKSWRVFITQ